MKGVTCIHGLLDKTNKIGGDSFQEVCLEKKKSQQRSKVATFPTEPQSDEVFCLLGPD